MSDQKNAISTAQAAGIQATTSLLLMLSALTALAPLGTDIYLSAIPLMAGDFDVAVHEVEISISYFLLGLSLGQLLGGPLSDRFGRRKLVISGLGIFALSSLGILLSDSLVQLWSLRFIQAGRRSGDGKQLCHYTGSQLG